MKNLFCLPILFLLFACRSRPLTGNPYLDAKVRPSEQQRKEDREAIAKGNRAYAEQLKMNRAMLAGNLKKATAHKRRYKIRRGKVRQKRRD